MDSKKEEEKRKSKSNLKSIHKLKLKIEKEKINLQLVNSNLNHYVTWISIMLAIAFSSIMFFLGLYFALGRESDIFLKTIIVIAFIILILALSLIIIMFVVGRQYKKIKTEIDNSYDLIEKKL
jgi:amino acid transporter